MYKATVVYGIPRDPAAFDRHYREVHIPLARRIPGIAHWTITRCEADGAGRPPGAYLTAELYAETRADLLAAFASPEGLAASRDVEHFADGGVQFLFGAEEVVTTTPGFGRS